MAVGAGGGRESGGVVGGRVVGCSGEICEYDGKTDHRGYLMYIQT